MFSGARQDGCQIAFGMRVFGILKDRFTQRAFRVFVSAKSGVGNPEADIGVRVIGIKLCAALERFYGFFNTAQFAQADAVVVGDLGVVKHAVESLKDRKIVVQIVMLQ